MDRDGEVVAVVVFDPVPARRAELLTAVRRGISKVMLVPGCKLYTLQERDSGDLVLIQTWASRAHLEEFLNGPVAVELLESYQGLLASPPVGKVMEPRAEKVQEPQETEEL